MAINFNFPFNAHRPLQNPFERALQSKTTNESEFAGNVMQGIAGFSLLGHAFMDRQVIFQQMSQAFSNFGDSIRRLGENFPRQPSPEPNILGRPQIEIVPQEAPLFGQEIAADLLVNEIRAVEVMELAAGAPYLAPYAAPYVAGALGAYLLTNSMGNLF
ncbi:MAG: hypothetical protein KGP13_05730 [Burkholderiales bacterium]|jgi:hypothetical protein|nr:hypothetical protein [Burkholderiales bacterium]